MIDVQGFAAVGGVFLAMMTLFGVLFLWLLRDMKQDIRELRTDMRDLNNKVDRIHSDLLDRMDRNHRGDVESVAGAYSHDRGAGCGVPASA